MGTDIISFAHYVHTLPQGYTVAGKTDYNKINWF